MSWGDEYQTLISHVTFSIAGTVAMAAICDAFDRTDGCKGISFSHTHKHIKTHSSTAVLCKQVYFTRTILLVNEAFMLEQAG